MGICHVCGTETTSTNGLCKYHQMLHMRKWRENNKKKVKETQQSKQRKDKLIVINKISKGINCCICCSEKDIKFLTLDHIHGDGAEKRKETGSRGGWMYYSWLIANNFPEDHKLQIMCYNCNCAKRDNNNICPHEEERQLAIKLKEQEDNEKYSLPLFLDF